jgi:cold shock CspA family protein
VASVDALADGQRVLFNAVAEEDGTQAADAAGFSISCNSASC